MIRILGLAAALAAGAAAPLLPPSAPAAAQQQDFRWSGRLARGEQITVKGIIGDVRAEPASGDEVTVTAVRRGRGADRVRVEVVRRSEGVVVCAVYPRGDGDDGRGWAMRHDDDDDDDDRGNRSEDDDQGRREPRDACNRGSVSVRNGDARVDFTVRVPAGVRVSLASVTGDVYAAGLRSPVRAASVSGSVHVSSDGPVQASSVSGDVEATMGRAAGESLRFSSVSGNVVLRVPASTDADFSARTLSGSIESDFPLELGSNRDRRGRRDHDDDDDDDGPRVRVRIGQEAHGQLGRGGTQLRVNTVSGDISLVRISR
ncbi:MAG TPA: DUF4097 family beta strand repeat-containing protein [Longimicrobium sp.]|nr:DUF4097 family beta strand repeat-containing protein [Longimicrobium sp.]